MASHLFFPPDTRNDGFSIDSMARRNGTPETVIRELLQNSLDAAREAGRGTREDPARVTFTITECNWGDIPGEQNFRRAFSRAENHRRQQGNSLADIEERVVRRIRDALSRDTVQLLMCRDNGVGIDDMERIMNEANTSKPKKGGGSIGVGHLTAYAASDTRYILYAGRSVKGDIAGGHAILATHVDGSKLVSANGYYIREDTDLFSLQSRYQADMPRILRQELDILEETGSVVCITGFNEFHENNPVEEISKIAAIYFLAAILQDELVVEIEDKLRQKQCTVDSTTLRSILGASQNEQRTRTGWLAGSFAMRAFETLKDGRKLSLDPYLEIWYRRLPTKERSQVNIFRGGMWVMRNPARPAGLSSQALSNLHALDCVVLLHPNEDDDTLYSLARAAEGTDHIDFEHYAAMSPAQKTKMRAHFEKIAQALSDAVGIRADESSYSPEGFASVPFIGSQARRVLPPIRPRTDGKGTATTDTEDTEEQREHTDLPGPKPGPSTRPGTRPTPGRRIWVRSTINVGEDAKTLVMDWRPQGNEDSRNLAVRFFVPSGSDETCEHPLPPQWLQLKEIESNGVKTKVSGDRYELPLPHNPGVVKIHLAKELANIPGIELDVVRRRPATASTQGGVDSNVDAPTAD